MTKPLEKVKMQLLNFGCDIANEVQIIVNLISTTK